MVEGVKFWLSIMESLVEYGMSRVNENVVPF